MNDSETDSKESISPARMRTAAMDLLARREHSRKELLLKLSKKFSIAGSASLAEQLQREVDKLQSEGLQSDKRLVENFILYRITKGRGPLKIQSELRNKGIEALVIEESLAVIDVNWCELADSVALKRFGNQPPKDMREKARRVRFLQQRGFEFEHFENHG